MAGVDGGAVCAGVAWVCAVDVRPGLSDLLQLGQVCVNCCEFFSDEPCGSLLLIERDEQLQCQLGVA